MADSNHTDHVRTAIQCLDIPGIFVRDDGWSPQGDRMVQEAQVHALLAVEQQLRVRNLLEVRKEYLREGDFRRASMLLNTQILPLLGLNP